MIKVLYVFGGEKASGAEIVIERLMSYNLKQVEPHLFVSPGKFADDLIRGNKVYPIVKVNKLRKLNRSSTSSFKFYTEALKNYFLISLLVIKYVKAHKIDVIHANTIVPASYLLPAIVYSLLFYKGRKWIWSDHDLKYFSTLDHIFSKACLKLYNQTIVVSNAVQEKYGKSGRVVVLYNGLDTNVYRHDAVKRQTFRNSHNFTANHIVFAIAATISPRKGQLELIEVFKKLLVKYDNARLAIAGGFGSDDDKYNEDVKKAIEDCTEISYLGHVDNMTDFYCGTDVIVNNSSKEGGEPLGTTIYEAMACEKIVVASNTGGTPEIITNNVDGFIFSANESEELFRLLNNIILNYNNAGTIRLSAREKVVEMFSLNNMAARYNRLLMKENSEIN